MRVCSPQISIRKKLERLPSGTDWSRCGDPQLTPFFETSPLRAPNQTSLLPLKTIVLVRRTGAPSGGKQRKFKQANLDNSFVFLTSEADLSSPALGGGSLCTQIKELALINYLL